jgi:hypothetical protein
MKRMLGTIIMLIPPVVGMAQPQQFDLDVPATLLARADEVIE